MLASKVLKVWPIFLIAFHEPGSYRNVYIFKLYNLLINISGKQKPPTMASKYNKCITNIIGAKASEVIVMSFCTYFVVFVIFVMPQVGKLSALWPEGL